MTDALRITKNDLQPYYVARVQNANGTAVNISGDTIVATMKNISTSALKIDRQSAGINITTPSSGDFEYRWVSGDTDTVGTYKIEFEVTPLGGGGKFTIPQPHEVAIVEIIDSLDTT